MGEKTCARLLRLLVRAEGVAEKDEKWAPWIRECGVIKAAPQARGGVRFRGWEIEAEKATRCG